MIKVPHPYEQEIVLSAYSIPSRFLVIGNEDAPTGRVDHAHVTVKYGLETNDVNAVADVIRGHSPIVVTFGKMSVFHNEGQAVIKIAMDSIGLKQLNRDLSKGLQCTDSYRTYRPHCTVAYMVHNEKNPYYYQTFFNDSLEGQSFLVNEVIFSAPNGQKSIISFDGEISPFV